MTLTQAEVALLSSTAQRGDHLLALPANLKGGAAQKVVSKLLAGGLVQEIEVRPDQPRWRANEEGAPIGLSITEAGLSAIQADLSERPIPDPVRTVADAQQPLVAPATAEESSPRSPRSRSKQALVLALLSRPEGVTI